MFGPVGLLKLGNTVGFGRDVKPPVDDRRCLMLVYERGVLIVLVRQREHSC